MGTDIQVYLRQIKTIPLLSLEREQELARRLIRDNDEEARQEMISSNLALVVAAAKRYADRGATLEDLIQEGNIGLLRAVEGFNPEMNVRFSTYAMWWIKQSMRRATRRARYSVHIPEYMLDLIRQWKEAAQELEEQLGREGSFEEIREHLQMSRKTARAVHQAVRDQMRLRSRQVDEERGRALPEHVCDAAPRADEIALTRDAVRKIHRLLRQIRRRDALVLQLRYGMEGDGEQMLDQIGTRLGVTRERVRQIEKSAMRFVREKWYLSELHPSHRPEKAGVGAS